MSTKIRRDETASSFGHYDDAAREYVVTDPRTPTKWVNYIGTLDFGGFVDQTGGLNICKKDPANNRITGYKIDTPQNAMRAIRCIAGSRTPTVPIRSFPRSSRPP